MAITIFTIPKAFVGHIAIIQNNAIKSWLALRPKPNVILLGSEEGVQETAEILGVKHIKTIRTNTYGTPILSDAFRIAFSESDDVQLCYINCDIILFKEFAPFVMRYCSGSYAIIGKRTNIDVKISFSFDNDERSRHLKARLRRDGERGGVAAIDYIAFPKLLRIATIPDFAVGRPRWDQWFLGHLRKNDISLIDATLAIFAGHQNHNYDHVKSRTGPKWQGTEADQNAKLAEQGNLLTIADADFLLSPFGHVAIPWAWFGKLRRTLGNIKRLFA